MANKLEEFNQLTETWYENFFEELVIFAKRLNNNKKCAKNKEAAEQVSSILIRITDGVFNYESLYPLLSMVFHTQSTLSQTDLHNKLTTEKSNKKGHQCYQLIKELHSTIPTDIKDQKLIAGIFQLNRIEAPLNQLLNKIGAEISDKFKMKDDETRCLKQAVVNLEKDIEKKEQVEKLVKIKSEEIDTLKNNIKQISADNEMKQAVADKLDDDIKQRDRIIEALKKDVTESKLALEARNTENNRIKTELDESVKEKDRIIKALEKDVTESKIALKTKTAENNEIKTTFDEDVEQKDRIIKALEKDVTESKIALEDLIKQTTADNIKKERAAVKLTRHAVDLEKIKNVKIDTLKKEIEQLTADNAEKEGEIVELSRQRNGEIKELNDVIKGMEDEFRTSEQTNKNLKTENATLTQKAGKLQETIQNKERMIKKEQSKYSSLRASRLQKAVNKQCDDRCKNLHQEQLDKLTTNFENILQKRANKMVDDSIEEVKVLRSLSQFKPDIQLQKLNFKDATFLKDQNNIDLNKVNNESAKRKGNTVLPVATKRARSS